MGAGNTPEAVKYEDPLELENNQLTEGIHVRLKTLMTNVQNSLMNNDFSFQEKLSYINQSNELKKTIFTRVDFLKEYGIDDQDQASIKSQISNFFNTQVTSDKVTDKEPLNKIYTDFLTTINNSIKEDKEFIISTIEEGKAKTEIGNILKDEFFNTNTNFIGIGKLKNDLLQKHSFGGIGTEKFLTLWKSIPARNGDELILQMKWDTESGNWVFKTDKNTEVVSTSLFEITEPQSVVDEAVATVSSVATSVVDTATEKAKEGALAALLGIVELADKFAEDKILAELEKNLPDANILATFAFSNVYKGAKSFSLEGLDITKPNEIQTWINTNILQGSNFKEPLYTDGEVMIGDKKITGIKGKLNAAIQAYLKDIFKKKDATHAYLVLTQTGGKAELKTQAEYEALNNSPDTSKHPTDQYITSVDKKQAKYLKSAKAKISHSFGMLAPFLDMICSKFLGKNLDTMLLSTGGVPDMIRGMFGIQSGENEGEFPQGGFDYVSDDLERKVDISKFFTGDKEESFNAISIFQKLGDTSDRLYLPRLVPKVNMNEFSQEEKSLVGNVLGRFEKSKITHFDNKNNEMKIKAEDEAEWVAINKMLAPDRDFDVQGMIDTMEHSFKKSIDTKMIDKVTGFFGATQGDETSENVNDSLVKQARLRQNFPKIVKMKPTNHQEIFVKWIDEK